jgi:hypothetical protein
MLVWCWMAAANAAELVIQMSGPGVQVQVDGTFYDNLSGTVTVHELEAGTHTIRIVDMLSKPILTKEVVVAANDYVVMKYKSRNLTEVNRSTTDDDDDDGGSSAAEPTAKLELLLDHVRSCETAAGQHDVIRFAGALWTFSATQVVELMGTFDKDADKVAVVKTLQARLVDPGRSAVLEAAVSESARPQIRDLFD